VTQETPDMAPATWDLPYFDHILTLLRDGDSEVIEFFGRHVHWGYWPDPATADGSVSNYVEAAERLTQAVLAAAEIRSGQRVLDVGCGFGGTLELLNQRHSRMELVGLNIDIRQLFRARTQCVLQNENRLALVAADACLLPFRDKSFDQVLCVEAVFHFSSRTKFFAEVGRVLAPGGRLTLCDFVPRFVVPWLWDFLDRRFKPMVTRLFGHNDARCTLADYRRVARSCGLRLDRRLDVTRHTMPTYRALRPLIRRIAPDPDGAEEVIRRVEFASRIGLLRYLILSFRPR
jgi:ubiquinone/menaquinone biosynthesis C-methylase UbiE